MISVSAPHFSTASCSGSMFPTDFDIFSPLSRSMPLCAHTCANGRPPASDCAISFSWCGKIRSRPPPCSANSRPSHRSAIAEHSMCQPGRPRPQGESHHVSSPGLLPFQSAKSSGSRLCSPGSADPAPSSSWSMRWLLSIP